MSTHNLCFEQKYEKYQKFLSKNFHFLVGKFSVYLNRRVFVMSCLDKKHAYDHPQMNGIQLMGHKNSQKLLKTSSHGVYLRFS